MNRKLHLISELRFDARSTPLTASAVDPLQVSDAKLSIFRDRFGGQSSPESHTFKRHAWSLIEPLHHAARWAHLERSSLGLLSGAVGVEQSHHIGI